MGWYFTPSATRAQVIAELNREGNTVRHCLRGNVLWSVRLSESTGRLYIGCDLLQREPGGNGWGHKPMDESVGPYYFDCPLAYLRAADPPINSTAVRWRRAVDAYHAARKNGAPHRAATDIARQHMAMRSLA